MRRLLIVGCGDIGLRVANLLAKRYRIYALTRSRERQEFFRRKGIVPVYGDLDHPETLRRLAGLAEFTLHFAPPQSVGSTDMRTRNLLFALSQNDILPQRLVYISTSGVYGNCAGETVSETRPINPVNPRARRRAHAERILREWGKKTRVTVSILRVPGIYSVRRLPIDRLKNATPALHAAEDSYSNHIHAQDLARISIAALHRGKPGRIYNACDSMPLLMGDYFDLVADTFHLPRPTRISWEEAQIRLSEGLLSFMSESRKLSNRRMLKELRIKLLYPDVVLGLRSISLGLDQEPDSMDAHHEKI